MKKSSPTLSGGQKLRPRERGRRIFADALTRPKNEAMSHMSKNEAMRASVNNLRRRSAKAKIEAMRALAKNFRRCSQAPTLKLRLFEFSSQGHQKSSIVSRNHDSNSYCAPSLGLRNTAGAEILEGDVWGALKIEHAVARP